jgi:hypothetical protein
MSNSGNFRTTSLQRKAAKKQEGGLRSIQHCTRGVENMSSLFLLSLYVLQMSYNCLSVQNILQGTTARASFYGHENK